MREDEELNNLQHQIQMMTIGDDSKQHKEQKAATHIMTNGNEATGTQAVNEEPLRC